MGHRQKGKGMKRKSSWHTRGSGPDWAFMKAIKKIEKAEKRAKGDGGEDRV